MTAAVPADSELAGTVDRVRSAGIRRVGIVTWRDLDDPGAGGSEIHINHLASLWAGAGLDVTIHTGAVTGALGRGERDGVAVVRAGGRIGSLVRGPIGIVRGSYDAVVEAWHGFNFLAPLWAGTTPRVGIAHHVHQEQFGHLLPAPAARVAAFVERRVYPKVYARTELVTLSQSTRAELVELGYEASRVTVAEPGVAPQFVPGARSSAPTVVAVGRLMPQKRMDAVIRMLVAVRRDVPDLAAEIIGGGPDAGLLRAQIDAAGAGTWLQLRGRVDEAELVSAYQRAWLVVSASASEGWGMSLSEAAACATPAVATDIPGHRDVIDHGRTGFLATTESDMAHHVLSLVRSRARVEEMGAAARSEVARFTWERCAARTLAPLAGATTP